MSGASRYATVALKDHVFELRSRNRDDQELPVYSVTNTEGFVPSEDFFKKQVFSKDTSNYKRVPSGAFAYNPSRVNVGSLDFLRLNSSVLVSPLYIVFGTSEALFPPYLKSYLLSEGGLKQINHHTQGAVRDSLKFSGLQKIEIPLPPLDEQKRIAAVLDKADALRRQRQESLKVTEKLLQSIFIDMFGDPVRNTKNLPTDDLSNLAKLERGKFTPRPRNDPSYFGGPYPFIQTGDITRSGGRITSWTQTLNEKGARVSKEFGSGTVVIAIVGATLGETAIVETPVYCPDSIIGITPFPKKATSEFIEFLLRLWKPRLKELAPDAARANLNLERLRPLAALAPPIEEQKKFSSIATQLRELAKTKLENENQLNRLFSSIQQRAFRGELDLSRLVLEPEDATPPTTGPVKPATKPAQTKAATRFIQAPSAIEAALQPLDRTVAKGDPIPWSLDYFKYRILAAQPAPIRFVDLMQKAQAVFDEPPPYEQIKDLIYDLLGQDGKPALLRQRFDLLEVTEKNEAGKETSSFVGSKEIVFEPMP